MSVTIWPGPGAGAGTVLPRASLQVRLARSQKNSLSPGSPTGSRNIVSSWAKLGCRIDSRTIARRTRPA